MFDILLTDKLEKQIKHKIVIAKNDMKVPQITSVHYFVLSTISQNLIET